MDQDILTMLELIRLEGIIKMLWDTIDHDELAETVHVICQNQNENIRSELERLSRQQLIEVASQHDDIITIDVVTQYYEQYRYGLKPGFTIYLLTGDNFDKDCETLFRGFRSFLDQLPDEHGKTIRKIQCKNYSQLADSIIEFSMSYLKKHSYLDEDESPQFVYEYEEFFVWLNMSEKYMAIKKLSEQLGIPIEEDATRFIADASRGQIPGLKSSLNGSATLHKLKALPQLDWNSHKIGYQW